MKILSQFVVTRTRRQGFHHDGQIALAAAGLAAASAIPGLTVGNVQPLATVFPVELDITYGLTDDPTSGEEIELFLMVSDEGSFPPLASARTRSWWSTFQHWRALSTGTGINTFRTDDHQILDFFNPNGFENITLDTRRIRHIFHIGYGADQAQTSDIKIMGIVVWQEILIQRMFGNDNWTFNTDAMNKEGLSMVEEMAWA